MVTIVLPTYNGEKYIRQSIESVIGQTYKEWELIVIDDCSTDHTNQIVKEYVKKDHRVKLYKNLQNLRLPSSLNVGFKKSRGQYLIWTSDDNLFKPEALETLRNRLRDNPKLGLVFSDMDYIDSEGRIIGHTPPIYSVNEIFYRNIVGASFMYRREVYQNIGDYNNQKFLVEDYDYWLRIARKFDIQYVEKSLYLYRQHKGSLTETKNHDMLDAKVKLLEEGLNATELNQEIKAMIYRELAIANFSLDRFDQMKFYIKKLRCIQKSISNLPQKVRISYRIGEKPTQLIKKIYRVTKKRG